MGTYGAIAQLVEHLHGMQGVSGSNPLGSIDQSFSPSRGFFCAYGLPNRQPHWGNGLGRLVSLPPVSANPEGPDRKPVSSPIKAC